MPKERPKYEYWRRGPLWVVYRMRKTGDITEGDRIAEFFSKKDAEEMVYRLNGWKPKMNSNNKEKRRP